MGLIDLLKSKKNKVVEEPKNDNKSLLDNIEIIIEDSCGLFPNEKENIIENALLIYNAGKADDIETAIIFVATTFRGLKYEGITKDENGKTLINFRDMVKASTRGK